jgi:hypothetical protein
MDKAHSIESKALSERRGAKMMWGGELPRRGVCAGEKTKAKRVPPQHQKRCTAHQKDKDMHSPWLAYNTDHEGIRRREIDRESN